MRELLAAIDALRARARAGGPVEVEDLDGLRALADARVRAGEETTAALDALFEAAPVGLAFFDLELRFRRVNRWLAHVNGHAAGDHVGRTPLELFDEGIPGLQEIMARWREVLATGEPWLGVEVTGETGGSGGHRIWREDFFPIRVGGEVAGLGGVVLDVTEERRALDEARAEARLRERVMAVVSHDLRTPLSTIVMAAEHARRVAPEGAPGDPIRRSAEAIARAARRMDRLIADLLDVTAIQTGRLAVHPAPHSPGELVREATEALRGTAVEKGVDLRSEWDPDLPPVLADHDRVLQVLGNLISNAAKVTPAGGAIGVRADPQGATVRFAVTDTGPGIAPEDQARIFEPYRRGAVGYQGTGLGLAIARGIVSAHGGRIGVESAEGRGARFWFTLPVAPGAGARAGVEAGA